MLVYVGRHSSHNYITTHGFLCNHENVLYIFFGCIRICRYSFNVYYVKNVYRQTLTLQGNFFLSIAICSISECTFTNNNLQFLNKRYQHFLASKRKFWQTDQPTKQPSPLTENLKLLSYKINIFVKTKIFLIFSKSSTVHNFFTLQSGAWKWMKNSGGCGGG